MIDVFKGILKFAVEKGPYIRHVYSEQGEEVRVSLEYFLKKVFLVLTVVLVAAEQQIS